MKGYITAIILLLVGLNVTAGKIKKGFQCLEIYNYFDAKRYFEKALDKDETAAAYGLSIIYLRNDNPFSDLDSAYRYIVRSTESYSNTKEKKKEKYKSLGIDSLSIFEYRDKVSSALYNRAKKRNSVTDFQRFIDRNTWSSHVDSAIYFRDELAFEKASEANTAAAFSTFVEKYPNSERKEAAQSAYERLNYLEQTKANNFIDYVAFVKNFPNSPYRSDAEDRIFEIYTETGSFESYKTFIDQYPDNRNVPVAWKKMFNTYLQEDYSTSSIQAFLAEFEDYPFKEDVLEELDRVERTLYPIKERNKWGYIDKTGTLYIEPKFDGALQFNEGLAIVSLDGKYGFADKTGEIVIQAIFDDAFEMNEGHAVVELDEKLGLINRSGEFVILPKYEDLGNLNEGLTYFSEEDLYGYFDRKGIVRLKQQYTSADDFSNGLAIVSKQGNYGLIDVFGTTSIPFKYERLIQYEKNVYAAKFTGVWGLLNEKGDTILPFEYEFIGKMSDNRAIVEKDGSFNYITPEGGLILEEWIKTYPEYRQLAVFNNGYAKIQYDDGYNLIDTTGKKLFSQNKEGLGVYGKYIAVKKGEKWGYLNKTGNLVIGYNYTSASSFQGNMAKAGGAPLVGIIDKSGNYLVEPYFEKLDFFNDTVLLAKSRGSYGLLLTNGDTLLNFSYVSIEPFSAEVVQLETRESIYYYHLKLNKFIRKEEE